MKTRLAWLFGLALVVGIVLTGRDTFGATLLTATFPARGDGVEEFYVKPLPISFWDGTGLVTEIDPRPVDLSVDWTEGVRAVPGSPNELVISWLGGACEDHVAVMLREESGQLRAQVDSSMSLLTLGCVAVGIARDLKVTFGRAVSADEVVLKQLH